MEYNPENTALVVVDMQNDFCHPDGALYAEGSENAIAGVNEAIDAIDIGTEIFLTQDTHKKGHPEFEQWGEHCLDGSWGHEFHEGLNILPEKWSVVQKDSYDAFHETSFNHRLQGFGIDTLIICGTLANVCVQETASSAALHGYDVSVVRDAVGYIEPEQREAALSHIDFLIGDVVSVEDL
jgi:nicotinamidase-related amidase